MRARESPRFGEKIQQKINEQPPKHAVSLLSNAFYGVEYDQSAPFFVRRTNLLRDEANKRFSAMRTLNVPDEELETRQKEEEFQIKEERRDQTWEEFLSMYQDHIEKRVDPNLRTGSRKELDNHNALPQ